MSKRMNKFSLAALLLLGVFLYSCAVGPDFQKPETQVPKYFTNYDSLAVDTLVNLKWWEIFNDPTLDTLVITALQQNKNVNIAISRIEESRANLGFTKADLYPRIDIEGSATRGTYVGGGLKLDSESNGFFIALINFIKARCLTFTAKNCFAKKTVGNDRTANVLERSFAYDDRNVVLSC